MREYLVTKHLSGVLEELRYLNLEVPDIIQVSSVAVAVPRCFLFQRNFRSSQIHLNIEHKIFPSIEKVFPSSSTFETLNYKNLYMCLHYWKPKCIKVQKLKSLQSCVWRSNEIMFYIFSSIPQQVPWKQLIKLKCKLKNTNTQESPIPADSRNHRDQVILKHSPWNRT